MAKNDLIIDDDYCREMGEYFISQGEDLEQIIAEYIVILDDLKEAGLRSGEVAEALEAYILYVKKIKGNVNSISKALQRQINNFLSQVDEADQYLF